MHFQNLPDPIYITSTPALERLIEELSCEPIIAVDTEANGLFAYREQVCLIQFSTPQADYLVDSLALKDLSPLGQVFENPGIEKVFHASEYDMIILHQDFGFSVNSLFDTMIGARILGWKAVGLGSILADQFDIKVDKKYQRANWGQRPLPKDMLRYAQIDTHYLISLRNKIKTELEAKGRWQIAIEDFIRCSQVDSLNHRNGGEDCWRIRGAHDLKPQHAAVLRELCKVRDQKAKTLDRPLFKVISDKALLQVAQMTPTTMKELERMDGISHRQARWLGKGILDAVERGLHAEPIRPKRKPRPSNDYLDRVERLRQWRQEKAKKIDVMSDVILPRDLLYKLADKNPGSKGELEPILESVPWRLQAYGKEILGLLETSNFYN